MRKPNFNKVGHFKYGIYQPQHPNKYVGNVNEIMYRSGWERKFMVWLDLSTSISRWSSEPVAIPYINPIDGKIHRYYIDFWVEREDNDKYIVEIKPYKQTQKPTLNENTRSKKKIEQYNNSARNYIINLAKWKAAEDYANKNGIRFLIITEKELKF
jgi:hypothetical protein